MKRGICVLVCMAIFYYRCDVGEYEQEVVSEDLLERETDTIERPGPEAERSINWQEEGAFDDYEITSNVPPSAIDHFEKGHPDVKVGDVEWYIDKKNYYNAYYHSDGERYVAEYDQEGNWQETRKEINWEDAPPSIRSAYNSAREKGNGWRVNEIYEVERLGSDEKFYSVKQQKEVYMNERGEVIEQEAERLNNN